MPGFKVAHIRKQGIDLIIIPLDRDFGLKTSTDQNAVIVELQARASGVGLAGTVVPVWDAGSGRMAFIAPQRWHAFFQSIGMQFVGANLNKEIYG